MTDQTGTTRNNVTRRSALIGAGAGGGALLLAACSSGSSSGAKTTATTAAPATTAATTAETTTAAPTTAATTASGTTIIALSKVPVGKAVSAKDKDGGPIIVAQPSAGQAVAFSAVCPHMQCTVAPMTANLECPCHHSKFESLTGSLINGPAPTGLSKLSVSVVGGNVVQT